ncbi:MAG: iron-containing alcohol dehydrogenase [Bryobacteraceae bacterium]|nr:iron-containing alcohol dehydrogenase [Bryobacteraceae bacterium]
MPLHTFHAPSAVIVGAGARYQLAEELSKIGSSRVLIVTDAHLRASGMLDDVLSLLERSGIQAHIFANVQPDPTVQNVLDGVAALRASGADAIVAIGGGSPIDAAKIIGVASVHQGLISDFQGYHRIPAAGPPLIAVPTTAGTGSEATKVAVITDPERQVKMMILDPKLMPRVAIVDYELTMSMPAALTAHVGVDTLTHGIEAFVSRKANPMSEAMALSCVELTAGNLLRAWQQPDDASARSAMSVAACQGGMAFTNSGLCLVHGMSRPLGAVFHLPHGLSNAVLLPAVTRFSVRGAPQRYARIARTMGLASRETPDEDACHRLVQGLEELNQTLEIPRLRACINRPQHQFEAVLEKMVADGLASGSPQNNPVVPSAEQMVELYREAW